MNEPNPQHDRPINATFPWVVRFDVVRSVLVAGGLLGCLL
jgi:hypothetical protein